MERSLEPELMDDPHQALAYAKADFSEENQYFVIEFNSRFPEFSSGHVVDLGCGPADIPIRFIRKNPQCIVTGIDASRPMIALGEKLIAQHEMAGLIKLRCEKIQDITITPPADAILSNSLLHHISNPTDFWNAIKRLAKPGAPILIMDLLRPLSKESAQAIVDQYAHTAPQILRTDFYNSLLAAFTSEEVQSQLDSAGLSHFTVTQPDDRHWITSGYLPK